MSTTDSRSGFRLPWTADAPDSESPSGGPQDVEIPPAEGETTDPPESTERAAEATIAATDPWGIASSPAPSAAPEPVRRKPNKLMADLARAMQAAAEAAREETLTRLQSEAKTVTEEIHGRSGTEAAELRQRADEDAARIRDWSKAEIARIREETDERIAERKATLEEEIENHAARIEQRIERVQSRVAAFEQEMAAFFERLLAEEDPTALAAMAENLPEPPEFDRDEPVVDATADDAVVEAPVEPVDHEAAYAAIQAAAEAAVTADQEPEPETDAGATADAGDPRLSVLGLMVGSAEEAEAAAEADAAAAPVMAADVEGIPTLADDAVAARLAGLVPAEDAAPAAQDATTRVVVVGLVSVASIAGFKRQLGRLDGVRSVGVSSGPDGEFVFAVEHDAAVGMRDAVTTLPGFGARVTDENEDGVFVTARDPETES